MPKKFGVNTKKEEAKEKKATQKKNENEKKIRVIKNYENVLGKRR